MKDFNPASPKTNSTQKRANSMTYNVSRTITIVNHAYVVNIVMTKWYILGFTLKHAGDDFFIQPAKGWGSPLPPWIYIDALPRVSSAQIPLTPSRSIRSLANKIKKIVSTKLNYAAAYNNILGVVAQYNSDVGKPNRLGKKIKSTLLLKTRASIYTLKCRGPVKNYKVKINSSMSGASDISSDSNSMLSILCESFPYLNKVMSL
ncbi:MAG: hypothetical protein QY309_15350 [Cyclobacteriaceae bacterium]|nr:MAG: hypothetical protein QY309_15350 [Cyclobacteriaceae bacterium]